MHIKVSFVEDDPQFSEFLRSAFVATQDLRLLNEASSQSSGLELLKHRAPDVLLVDIGLPDGSGLEVIRQAHLVWPQCPIMVVTVFGDQTNILAAIKAGAQGYLLKGMPAHEIAAEIRVVHQGGSSISPNIAKQILHHLRSELNADVNTPTNSSQESLLTEREHQVLLLANKGLTYIEVATTLGISTHTVRTHVKRAYQKLQVSSKSEALYELQRAGQKFA